MTETALTPEQAQALARGIKGNRLAVAAVYDEIAARVGRELPDFKTVALGLHDAPAAFEAALLSAGTGTAPWHRILLSELAAQGLIDLPEVVAGDAASVSILPQNRDASVIQPQAFTKEMSPALGMSDLLNAFNQAARRLCLIEVTKPDDGSVETGTGFLVGPHVVLTNWHVVKALIDPVSGLALPGSETRLVCKFETLTKRDGRLCLPAKDWLLAFSPLRKAGDDPAPQAASPDGTFLDFCAIRLRGAPGRERGWYDLSQTGSLDNDNDSFFVFQHPDAAPQRAGVAAGTVVDPDPDFLQHKVWTSSGSSGGLCLDNRLRPIALHHAAVTHKTELDDKGKPKLLYNRAVRLSAIHKARPGLGAPDPKYDRIARLSDKSSAVIGREATQDTLRLMAAGEGKEILVINGVRQSGKSFTSFLVRDSMPPDRQRLILLSAGELPAEAIDLARLILRRARVAEADIDAALRPVASLTTAAATVADVFGILKKVLLGIATADPANPVLLWLVIDELDVAQLPGIGARTLLDQIYNDIELLKVMRIVLIGLTNTLLSVEANKIATEQLPDPRKLQEEEIERCLAGLMFADGLSPNVFEAQRHAALLIGATEALDAQGQQRVPLAVLSGLLSGVYMKAVEKWLLQQKTI